MYDNIGKKIKLLAKVVTIIFSVASIIVGIALTTSNVSWGAVFFFMPILFWISSFVLYGFGELIDKVCDIERNSRNGVIKSTIQVKHEDEKIKKLEKLRAEDLISEEEYRKKISE